MREILPDPRGGVAPTSLAVVAAGVRGVAVGVLHGHYHHRNHHHYHHYSPHHHHHLHREPGGLGVHAVNLGHAVLPPLLQASYHGESDTE